MKKDKIKRHEDKYWYVPKFNLLPLFGLIIFVFLSIGNYGLIDKEFVSKVFICDDDKCDLEFKDLINIYPIFGEYVLISLCIISIIALFKGGYKQLESYDEIGLIYGLIIGSITGLIFGLIFGLISGLIFGWIYGLISGLIIGSITGLLIGLIGGLIGEF